MLSRTTALVVLLAVLLASCGDGSSRDNTPTTPTPTIVQVAGNWEVGTRILSMSGGECVGQMLQSTVNTTTTGMASVTQSGSSVTAVTTDTKTGLSCTYTGTAGTDSVVMQWSKCDAAIITGITCPNGARRDMRLVSSGFTVNMVPGGNAGSGAGGETWNVFVAGTQTAAGLMTVSSWVSMARR